jgi:hypothetical protein
VVMASSRLVFDVRLSSYRFAAFVALNVITSDFLEFHVRVGDSETGWRSLAVTVMTVPACLPRSTCALCAGRGAAPKGSSVPQKTPLPLALSPASKMFRAPTGLWDESWE